MQIRYISTVNARLWITPERSILYRKTIRTGYLYRDEIIEYYRRQFPNAVELFHCERVTPNRYAYEAFDKDGEDLADFATFSFPHNRWFPHRVYSIPAELLTVCTYRIANSGRSALVVDIETSVYNQDCSIN